MMRGFFAWLMAFGVLAGLSARAVPLHELAAPTHAHHHHHDEGDDSPCDHEHPAPGDSKPCEKHHHGGCCSTLNLSAEHGGCVRLLVPDGVLLGLVETREAVPEEPVLEEDHPPLI